MREVKPRTRGVERRQLVVLLVLMVVVAGVSFALGWLVGRESRPAVVAEAPEQAVRQPVAAAETSPQGTAVEEAPKVNLTFYDTLPKGEATPLGSGINLPPEEQVGSGRQPSQPAAEVAPAAEKPVAKPVEQPVQKVEAAPAPKPPATSKTAAGSSGEYIVQVASFQSGDEAEALQRRLLARGHRAYLQTVDLGAKGVWTRVYIGFFRTADAAQSTADRIKAEEKITPIVRKR